MGRFRTIPFRHEFAEFDKHQCHNCLFGRRRHLDRIGRALSDLTLFEVTRTRFPRSLSPMLSRFIFAKRLSRRPQLLLGAGKLREVSPNVAIHARNLPLLALERLANSSDGRRSQRS